MDNEAPIPWLLRPDLVVSTHGSDGLFVIKDPMRLRYFRLEQYEWAFLNGLDGRTSLNELLQLLGRQFPDLAFAPTNLIRFLTTSIKNGLLISQRASTSAILTNIADQERSAQWKSRVFAAFVHRFRGIDPTQLLTTLHPMFRWCFTRTACFTLIVGLLSSVVLALANGAVLLRELPSLAEIATTETALSLAIAVVLVKILHEFGHAMTCHHFGGECHEMGVLMIGVFPLLYCDVTDSWMFRSRWHRIAVAAAGIVVELSLAAICLFLWILSVPGVIHSLFLHIVIVCSLNTVAVNGNPLLRYDGYYVLSDLTGIANLHTRARQAFGTLFDRFVLGVRQVASRHRRRTTAVLSAFGFASGIYRVFVMVAILWGMHEMAEPYGLEVIPRGLAVVAGVGMSLAAVQTVRTRVQRSAPNGEPSGRAILGASLFVAAIAAVVLTPLPFHVCSPAVQSTSGWTPVYATEGGRLSSALRYGSRVRDGAVVAELTNVELQERLTAAESERIAAESYLERLNSLRPFHRELASSIPVAQRALDHAIEQEKLVFETISELTVKSPTGGILAAPRNRSKSLDPPPYAQTTWSGLPLDAANVGAWLEPQTSIAWVAPGDRTRLLAYVGEESIVFVRPGQTVEFVPTSAPFETLGGTVLEVSDQRAGRIDRELAVRGAIAVEPRSDDEPVETLFEVVIELDSTVPSFSTGTVAIHSGSRSLARRGWDFVCQTFAISL